MAEVDLQHPDITWIEKTGYPSDKQEKHHYCGECGRCLHNKEVYSDRLYAYLCRECLLMLHEKQNWW